MAVDSAPLNSPRLHHPMARYKTRKSLRSFTPTHLRGHAGIHQFRITRSNRTSTLTHVPFGRRAATVWRFCRWPQR